ncbi:RdgB/HAM1 family non-canonical purine NTP pyrophosphatase [Synechococcus sp. A15-28]|jgi:XTP/dITP diphosphohydrolase|uniref:RdgB/HAM1 family non-canonical purine NTP pyrophosphatase n=1 Tax=Synechococcus sp. A15-28 TaxID=1050638 RepID=UPI000ECBB7B9|nr:RdgB/HAM1 family non-canonical purine NTP pyrophosphatase [Synechococcus sp. A15-28]MBA4733350.1 RdgB/HAM1 family non-canonical purine NTP pyrophosphatase [Synechococcus sp.]QNI41317.1 XTP/dITP diphosphohydrolase [Synechococcus sp. A15-28]HCA62033.1 non-canonical purine NTP pyrophosphatase, RdgB/HAM1 family [Synechococcales bacterium UBA8647]|tara:strand:+ start:125 stop:700 length:576 start_codon:yes stop_codon:yes gene_type:complete
MRTLVIASGNAGKIREFQGLLQHLPLDVQPQPEGMDVEETGSTFAANARIKAKAVATTTGHWALADDSGLSVNALGGAPGVHSARYAPTDPERINKLLSALSKTSERDAQFCAALCVAAPDGSVLIEVEGRCDGRITTLPRGEGGFGYDPIFEVSGTDLTFAEMPLSDKKAHGHRGRAFALLEPRLRALLS